MLLNRRCPAASGEENESPAVTHSVSVSLSKECRGSLTVAQLTPFGTMPVLYRSSRFESRAGEGLVGTARAKAASESVSKRDWRRGMVRVRLG